jgi:hypothetical protein
VASDLPRRSTPTPAADLTDTLNAKRALLWLGYFEPPAYGLTPYPDKPLFDGIRRFQKAHDLKPDGVMKPGGATERALAADLAERDENAIEKPGTYVWHTQGDGKVRSEHAERDGKIFSWDDPPEGGHPGEAPNCRCWTEAVAKEDCEKIKWEVYAAYRRNDALHQPILNADAEFAGRNRELAELNSERSAIMVEIAGAATAATPRARRIASFAGRWVIDMPIEMNGHLTTKRDFAASAALRSGPGARPGRRRSRTAGGGFPTAPRTAVARCARAA